MRSRPLDGLFDDDVLYHWSPRPRRKQIERLGLRPGMKSLDGMWRPPYVAFALNPVMAWRLATNHRRSDEDAHLRGPWDLWSTVVADLNHWELLFDHYTDTGGLYVYEVRVYERIFKRNLEWVAERDLT